VSNHPGRNEACPCGSGKKYKHCCALKKDRLSIGAQAWFILVGAMLLIGAWLAVTRFGPG
jgi:hypothetical protein